MPIYDATDTIFVQIPAYREIELQPTLEDLFAKAKRPENIFIGIYNQYDLKTSKDAHLVSTAFPRQNQLRIVEIDYRDARGCCFARSELQKLWQGEKWSLSIDSHMRFVENWDEKCVISLKEIHKKDEMAILSSYMPGYEILEDGKISYQNYISTSRVEFSDDLPNFHGLNSSHVAKILRQSPLIAAGFIFAKANLLNEIKYDPNLYFLGEEISLATRMWTSGYNFYVPNFTILYHLFKNNYDEKHISMLNDHLSSIFFDNKKDNIAIKRVKNMLKISSSDDSEVNKDIEKYNLGKKRTLRDYERFSGIDLKRKKQRQHTKSSIFCKWQETYSKEMVKKLFNN